MVTFKLLILTNFTMKKVFLALMCFSLFACEAIEDAVENALEESIEIEETVSEDLEIPILEQGENILDVITIDLTDVNSIIEDYTSDNYSIDELEIEDLVLSIQDADQTFDFLDSFEVSIASGDLAGTVIASLDNIPEGATSLNAEITDNLIDLIEILDNNEVDLEVSLQTNSSTDQIIDVEIITDFLVGLDIDL